MQSDKVQEQNYKLLNDDCFNMLRDFPEIFSQLPSDVGLHLHSQGGSSSTKLNLGNASITSITSSYAGSTSSFSTTEECMSLPRAGCHGHTLSARSQLNSLDLQAGNNLKLSFEDNQNLRSSAKLFQNLYSDLPGSHLFELLHKSAELDNTMQWRPTYISIEGNQLNEVSFNPNSSQLPKPISFFHPEKQPPNSPYGISITQNNSVLSRSGTSSKTRIRWKQDLHKRFVECVNHLGGADKANPKEIFKLMEISGLTILQVKSHLQKYRTARYIPESTATGKSDKRLQMNPVTLFDPKTGTQIAEALRLQLEVQKCLHQQLEVQKDIQLRIEEQGRQLKKMLDGQLTTNETLVQSHAFELTSWDHMSSMTFQYPSHSSKETQ